MQATSFKTWEAGNCTHASMTLPSILAHLWCTIKTMKLTRWYTRACLCFDYKRSDIFCLAVQIRRENVDDVRYMPMMHGVQKITMSGDAKQNAWGEHYETHLISYKLAYSNHHKFGEEGHLNDVIGNETGPSGKVVDTIRAAGDTGDTVIYNLT